MTSLQERLFAMQDKQYAAFQAKLTPGVPQVFLLAFHEMIIMWPVVFFLELLVVDSLAHKLAFRFVQPTDRPIVITLAISCMIVCIMCPCMSLIATVLFKNIDVSVYFQTTFINFPVALLFQIFYCGPLIRFLFGKIVHE